VDGIPVLNAKLRQPRPPQIVADQSMT